MKNYISILLFLMGNICFSQNNADKNIAHILNDLFKKEELIYQNYLNFKGLKIFIDQPLFFEQLYGQPCILKNSIIVFESLINNEEYNDLSMQISMFKGERINSHLLNSNIKLTDNQNNQNTVWVTKPLIFNGKAILYLKRKNQESILIINKNEVNEWVVICQKYLYLSIDN